MSAIHSGPPVLSMEEVADHCSSPPRMLLGVMAGAGLLFIVGLAAGAMYFIRTRL